MSLIQITVQTQGGPVVVTGDQVTEHFAVTPQVVTKDDGTVGLGDYTCLTHIPSGLAISYESYGQRERAARLEALPIDWASIGADNRITKEDGVAVRGALRGPDEEGWPWPEWAGDESTPALSTLAQTLDRALESDYWKRARALREEASEHLPQDLSRKIDAYLTAASSMVATSEYGLIYLLAVLHRIDPAAADRAARDLVGAWDAGDSMGEWQWQWRDELGKGQPLTLHGFPTLGDLDGESTAGYVVSVTGCDDENAVTLDLTAEEAAAARKIADAIGPNADWRCKPGMEVREAPEPKEASA